MADTRSWNSTVPSGTSSIRDGDNEIRNARAITQEVIAQEHYFDQGSASSQSGGIHKLGSARVYMTTRASVGTPASADSNGRLAFASDLGSLHVMGASSATTINWGADPPGGRWTSASTTHATSGSTLFLIFVTEDYDIGGYGAAGGSLFTVPSGLSGRHLITASVEASSEITGILRVGIQAAGSDYLAVSSVGSMAGPAAVSVTAVDRGADGANYRIGVFQSTGGSLSLGTCRVAVQRI